MLKAEALGEKKEEVKTNNIKFPPKIVLIFLFSNRQRNNLENFDPERIFFKVSKIPFLGWQVFRLVKRREGKFKKVFDIFWKDFIMGQIKKILRFRRTE